MRAPALPGPNAGGVGASLERIHAKLEALREIESARTAEVRLPFYAAATITGTTLYTVWTPTPGFKFCLKGFDVTVSVHTVLAAAQAVAFGFWDGTVAQGAIAPVCSFQATDPAGVHFEVVRQYETGVVSSAADRALVLGPDITIGSGKLKVMGVAWGDHVQA